MTGNWSLPCENKLIYQKIVERLDKLDEGVFISDQYSEFGGVTYLVQSSKDTPHQLQLSISLGLDDVSNDALHLARSALAPVASVCDAESGYDLTLKVNLAAIKALPAQEQAYWARSLASLRLLLAGHVLRQHFRALASGTCTPSAEPQLLHTTPRQQLVLALQADSITLVYPLHFEQAQDAAVACAFLMQFPQARRSAGGAAAAPSCSYMPAKAPPLEVQQCRQAAALLAAKPAGWPSAGYLSFTLFSRHVSGPQLEHVIWSLISLSELVHYHVSNCKAWMHGQMRGRVASMLQSLESAKGEQDKQPPVRRAASGRYMQQQSEAAVKTPPQPSHPNFRRSSLPE